MKWKLSVDPMNPIVPWNERIVRNREELDSYLAYFGVSDYNRPGQYICRGSDCGQSVLTIEYIDAE